MTSSRKVGARLAVCCLLLWSGPALRAAPDPDQGDRPSMDEVRAELNRLRDERARLREDLALTGGGKSKAVTGYATVETTWRFGTRRPIWSTGAISWSRRTPSFP